MVSDECLQEMIEGIENLPNLKNLKYNISYCNINLQNNNNFNDLKDLAQKMSNRKIKTKILLNNPKSTQAEDIVNKLLVE